MCFLCQCCDDPELCVDTLRTKLGDDGLSIPLEQKNALLEICNEIEEKILDCFLHRKLYLKFEDSKGGVLHKKYKEFETCVLQYDIIDWKQEEEKLRQFLLEYDNAEYDELRFGINSMPWLKVFRTHERSIPEPIRNCLHEMCKDIEEVHYEWIDTYCNASEAIIRRYQTLGHDVLEMEIVDWEDIRKSFKQILHDWNRGITVEDLDGKQHIIYHRLFYENDIDHLVNQVVDATGISKQEFVLVYGESLIVPGNKNLCIPDGAKIKLLPSNKELANQSIIVEDLDGQQHIINTNWVMYTKDVDFLVRQVAHTTGISKRRFVLAYREKLIVPGNHFYIVLPNGANIELLPVKKNQNPPTNLDTYVRGLFNGIYEQINRLFTKFPKVFEDHTRLLSEKDFVGISQLIGNGWGMLGIELGLSKVNLQQITEDKRNVASRIFEMLCQWGQTQKDGATAAQLLSAVRKCGVSCEFDKLKRALLIGM
ncbi:uncharacterized protein LOC132758560 isoform X2 [Ruditapes philippinarum]|uniref:uncharacterized protein LOC132758560 isoform X2 n=1 Tax=Ruditapes philippinarum TaxID=129788 RepID=UPI00295A8BF4|nr:uncharacterized protein LOC132758560 isoform X2 [Ruditapes philippinarum]